MVGGKRRRERTEPGKDIDLQDDETERLKKRKQKKRRKKTEEIGRNSGKKDDPVPHSHQRVVLSEEEYVRRLSSLIQRDFFPQAPALVDEESTLFARDRRGRVIPDSRLSVDTFHALYTSEDNDSFERLQQLAKDRASSASSSSSSTLSSRSLLKGQGNVQLLGDKMYTIEEERRLARSRQTKGSADTRKQIEYSGTRIADSVDAWGSSSSVLSAGRTETTSQAEDDDGLPRVNGYSFVVERGSFRIARQSAREKAAERMGRSANVRQISKRRTPSKQLSPAAKALARNLLGLPKH